MEESGPVNVPAAYARQRTGYPLNRRLGGPQSRSLCFENETNLLPGYELRIVQPVA